MSRKRKCMWQKISKIWLDKNGDDDYDYDRYDRDSDYADGVDDAMDEFGEDW